MVVRAPKGALTTVRKAHWKDEDKTLISSVQPKIAKGHGSDFVNPWDPAGPPESRAFLTLSRDLSRMTAQR
jgi:hypothetical protein